MFYKLLNLLAEMINRSEDNDVTDLLRAAYANGVPGPNQTTKIVAGQEVRSLLLVKLGTMFQKGKLCLLNECFIVCNRMYFNIVICVINIIKCE